MIKRVAVPSIHGDFTYKYMDDKGEERTGAEWIAQDKCPYNGAFLYYYSLYGQEIGFMFHKNKPGEWRLNVEEFYPHLVQLKNKLDRQYKHDIYRVYNAGKDYAG